MAGEDEVMDDSTRTELPLHPRPVLPEAEGWLLTLSDGSGETVLERRMFEELPHVELRDDFSCLEGWSVPGLTWRGVSLAELLSQLPSMLPGPYLAVSAPDTCAVIATDGLPPTTLLADGLDGQALTSDHGGPYRLVVPGGVCFESVKWVQRIERCDSPDRDSARSRATARLRPR